MGESAVITGVVWKATGGQTNGTAPDVTSNSYYAHAWIEVTYDKPVDVTVGASINVVKNEDGGLGQDPLYAAAQTNTTTVEFEYTNAGATSLFYLDHSGSVSYFYTGCANGSANDDPDFPYTISGTIKDAGTSTNADKTIASSEFTYYRINDNY